ncbi:MAG: MarR family winged helix-turn-helix transcriptional regulator [bacterium]|nr:MarR family winged helix-turn-helix transcriptional regulator [bacterium]
MLEDVQQTIGYLIVQICKAHRGCAEDSLNAVGLHAGQEMFLMHLCQQDGQTQSQLAERMGVQPPTVNKMLSRMESNGLVTRGTDSEDSRVSRVYLTEKSRALESDIQQAWADLEARTTANLTVDERVLLRRLLLQVVANLSEEGQP